MDHRDLAIAGALAPGTLIGDRFEVERLAGEGGMATVYRARDRQTDEVVAVKLLRAEAGENAERLVREARVLSRLGHPGIVRYVDHGTTSGGDLYLAMEWLEGEDLSQRLKRGPLTVEETLDLARRTAEALAAAHAQDLVHRDLKPSNLFLPGGGVAEVKVLDFGIVRLSQATIVATATGMILGTPAYMAPEQARGERLIDARADVFSLGCVISECLTGKQVFAGEHALAVLARILLEDAPRVSESRAIPAALDDLVARMLAKDVAERPADARALLALIDAVDPTSPLTGAVTAAAPSVGLTTGEQRVLAVVLVAGSPATRREIPQTYHLVASRHGGRIERLADGSLLVAMSGSATATDMVREAARCALALRDLAPGVAIALATGRGTMAERLPIGPVVDRAVERLRSGRIEDAGVRIDDVSAGLMGARFEVRNDDRGAHLTGERDLEDETGTLLGRATSCVGRERELGTLAGVWEECIQEPMAHAVVVTAPAGVGKSRVRSEFLRRVRDEGVPIEVLIARGDPITAGSPFSIVGQVVRRAARIADAEPLLVRQQKLQARVARGAAAEDVRRMTEFLAELVGAPIVAAEASPELQAARNDPRVMGDQMQRAFQEFVALECRSRPVLLVIEDMQWGDGPSVRFIDGLLRVLRDQPVMVLAMGRPEVEDLFPRLWNDRGAQTIRLGELTSRAATKLAREVLGADIPDATIERLVAQAAGNAYYLEELIRAVAEGRTGEMPETVVAMAQARLEQLAPELRRLLRAASVFGDASWRNGVEVLLGGPSGGAVDELLRTAVEHEVLVTANESRFPDERQFRFRHALMREAAYAALTEEDRVLGHRLAGDWLERAGEAEAAVLAEHFDRGAEAARAVPWYVEAARQALNGHDMVAVLARAARGVACGATGMDQVRMLIYQTQAHLWRGEHRDEQGCALEAMSLAPIGGPEWCHAAGMAMQASTSVGDNQRLLNVVEQVMVEARKDTPPEQELVTAMARAVKALLPTGQYTQAEQCVDWLTTRGAQVTRDGTVERAQLHVARGDMARVRGDLGAFLESRERALEIFVALGQERSACVSRENIGYAYLQLGMFAESEQSLREALALARRMELRATAMVALNNLGMARALAGDLTEGAALEEEALVAARAMRNPRVVGGVLLYQARIQTLAGNLERAETEARAAIEALAQAPPLKAYAHGVLAEVMRRCGRLDEAQAESGRAMDILASLGNLEEGETMVMVNRAEVLAQTGAMDGARALLTTACDRLRSEAAQITDPRYRQSYLENVPDHRRARELAREWALPGSEA